MVRGRGSGLLARPIPLRDFGFLRRPLSIVTEVNCRRFRYPIRAITKILGINRKAVHWVVENRKVSLRPEMAPGNRRSILDPFKPRIEGYLGGHSVLQEHVRKIRAIPPSAGGVFTVGLSTGRDEIAGPVGSPKTTVRTAM